MRSSPALAVAAVVASLALGTGLASGAPARFAGDVVGKDPAGDVRAKGLTARQKAAMDIVSVRADGAKGLGLFVTVTFRGNVEKEIGRGALARAAAALVLRPKPGQGLSSGLVSSGPGKVGTLRRHTTSTSVGAFRHGKKLRLFVLGPGYEKVKSVVVETVADAGPLGRGLFAAGGDTPYIGPRLWAKFITLRPLDFHVQTGDASALSCAELQDLLDSIDADLDDPFFSQNTSFAVTKALHAFRSTVKRLMDKCVGIPPPPPDPTGATFVWSRFSTNEVAGSGKFTGTVRRRFSSVRIVLPEGLTITNHLCPTQLPTAVITGNRIDCGGGILGTGEPFTLNLQTIPVPANGLGGSLYGTADATLFGPFQITGP